MAITSAICTSFKQEILVEGHNLTNGADSIKLALIPVQLLWELARLHLSPLDKPQELTILLVAVL